MAGINVITYGDWLRRMTMPCVLLVIAVLLWSHAIGFAVYRLLGVTMTSINGRVPTVLDELLAHGFDGAVLATFLQCVLFALLFAARITFRLWIVLLMLLVVGTPIALVSGWEIAERLWAVNQGGTPWESIAPQMIGMTAAWILYFPLSAWIGRYRIVIVRRDDARISPCPRCEYELYGSNGTCPECGWRLPCLVLDKTDAPSAIR